MIHSIGPINMCTDFERNRCKNRMFYLTSRDAIQYVERHGGSNSSDMYFDQKHFNTNQKSLRLPVQSYGSNSDFHVFGDLDLDL